LAPKKTKKGGTGLAGIVSYPFLVILFRLLGRFFDQVAMYPPQVAHGG